MESHGTLLVFRISSWVDHFEWTPCPYFFYTYIYSIKIHSFILPRISSNILQKIWLFFLLLFIRMLFGYKHEIALKFLLKINKNWSICHLYFEKFQPVLSPKSLWKYIHCRCSIFLQQIEGFFIKIVSLLSWVQCWALSVVFEKKFHK